MSNERVIPTGTFTVQSPSGEHRTFRIGKPKKQGEPRFIGLLTGPDNTASYSGFALIGDDNRTIRVFNKCRGTRENPTKWETYACMLEVMLTTDENWYTEKDMTIKGSRKCARCGRKLTEPESLRAGIGPVCGGRQA